MSTGGGFNLKKTLAVITILSLPAILTFTGNNFNHSQAALWTQPRNPPDDPDVDAALIRKAREAEWADRNLTVRKDVCKYESDIPTPPPKMKVALTFDDGPESSQTPYILETLDKYHIHASFFMIGQKAKGSPGMVRTVASHGHLIIGNHSWTHPNFHDISALAQAKEVLLNENLLGSHFRPKLFRYPYGNSSCTTNDLLHSRGYKIVGWHVDSCDWGFNKTGTVSETDAKICGVEPQFRSNFVGHVVASLEGRRGGILLMHEIQPHTIRQLETIIKDLIAAGFDFGTLDEEDFQSSLR